MTSVQLQTRVALVAVATDGWPIQLNSATERVGSVLAEQKDSSAA
jgi:hypothetical protein